MSVAKLEILSDMSRKRTHSGPDDVCIGGCGNPSCDQKRTSAMEKSENNVRWWYMKLESESEPFDSDEPDSLKNESLWSIQLRDTDSVHDSSDSESRWQRTHDNEYEVASLHSSENELRPFSSSSDDESCSSVEGLVIATVAPEGITIDYFADSSSDLSSSDDSSDPELQPQDKWACLRCKQKNQPIPRYCQHCFAVRKKWFPPRPTGRKKRGASSLASITIPPQIQITPNLSIPDLSQMKGDPVADNVQRAYDESVARFASLTDEQRLENLRERVRRHRLIRSHSESQMVKLLNSKESFGETENKVKSLLISSSMKERLFQKLIGKAQDLVVSEESSQDSVKESSQPDKVLPTKEEKGDVTSSKVSTSSVDTIPKSKIQLSCHSSSSQSDLDELDFRTKVKEYLAMSATVVPDTPPSSQTSDFNLSSPKASQEEPSTSLLDEDVVDGPFRPPPVPPRKDRDEFSDTSFSSAASSKTCNFCEVNEANTAFIHNGKGHLCACYPCAKKVYASKGQCPICQRQASTICKIYS